MLSAVSVGTSSGHLRTVIIRWTTENLPATKSKDLVWAVWDSTAGLSPWWAVGAALYCSPGPAGWPWAPSAAAGELGLNWATHVLWAARQKSSRRQRCRRDRAVQLWCVEVTLCPASSSMQIKLLCSDRARVLWDVAWRTWSVFGNIAFDKGVSDRAGVRCPCHSNWSGIRNSCSVWTHSWETSVKVNGNEAKEIND